MSEKIQELEGQLSAAASRSATWKSFLEHPGWKMYEDLINAQVNLRQRTILLTPLASTAQVFNQEFMKGEAAGAQLALVLAHNEFEQAELDRVRLTNQLEIEHEDEKSGTADEPRSRVDDERFSVE